MDVMTLRDDRAWNLKHRVPHQGTFNANPLTAAAGLATLKLVEQGNVIARANRAAALLRERLNEVIRQVGSNWVAYGEFSGFHLFLNPRDRSVGIDDIYAGRVPQEELKGGAPADLLHKLRCGLILGGADIFPWPGGCVSAVHTEEDVEITAAALRQTLELLGGKSAS
jgi:glutamate-1-semialdehyde 2,1-aminomutase